MQNATILLLACLFFVFPSSSCASDEGGPWLRSDVTQAGSWRAAGWVEPWNQQGHLTVVPDSRGGQALSIEVKAQAEANLVAMTGADTQKSLILSNRWVYLIEFEARSVGQIEKAQLTLRRRSNPYTEAGQDRFPVSKEWATYSTQIRPKADDDDSEVILSLTGIGQYQVRWVTITRIESFRLPPRAEGDRPRGELLDNPEMALGSSGWFYTTPEWGANTERFYALPVAERPRFTIADTGRAAFHAPPGIFGFLTATAPLQLTYGRQYRLRVRGMAQNDDVFGWIARPGQNVDIITKIPLVFTDGVATGVYAHNVPEFGTLSALAQSVYFRIEHFGKAPLDLTDISLCEVDPREVETSVAQIRPRISVTVEGLDPGLRALAQLGKPLSARIHATGMTLDQLQGASLEVRDARDHLVRRVDVKFSASGITATSAGKSPAIATIAIPDLPLGWYEAAVRVPGQIAVALADSFAVIPSARGLPRSTAKSAPFLATHVPSIDPRQIPFAARIGFSSARCFEFSWQDIEPRAGEDHFPTARLERYRAAGVSPLIILGGTPQWASSAPPAIRDDPLRKSWDQDHWSHYPPDSDEVWGAFVRRMVRLMKPAGVHAYEVWNEPNGFYMRFNPARDASLEAAYVRLATVAYRVIKEEDPQATVVAGSTAGQAVDFFTKAFALGLLDHCDAISYHAYGEVGREMLGAPLFAETVGKFHAMMAHHGKQKPIWDSESGATIADGPAGLPASLTLLQGIIARQAGGLARYFLYSGGPRDFPLHSNFHMVIGFADRPLVSAPILAVYHRLLGSAKFSKSLISSDGVHLYEFSRGNGAPIRIGWHVGPAPTVLVTQPQIQGVLLDAFGNRLSEVAGGTLELSSAPRYVVSAAELADLYAP